MSIATSYWLLHICFHLSVSHGQEDDTHRGCHYHNPSLASSFETIPQVPSGVQAILPYYRFHCGGRLNQVSIQVKGESTRLDIQLWRPSDDRTYSLKWSATYVGNGSDTFYSVNQPSLEGSLLVYTHKISVSEGDVLGYYIERSNDPIRMGYISSTTDPSAPVSVVHSLENVTTPLCSISLHDDDLKSIEHTAPLIYADFGKSYSCTGTLMI